jgi:hypothetical protein
MSAPRKGLLLTLALISAARVSAADQGSERMGVERHRFANAELLVLANDRLLLWNQGGRVAFWTGSGAWTQELQLPFHDLRTIVPDGSGFLAAGPVSSDSSAVALFDGTARELGRWTLKRAPFELFVAGGRRWVVEREGMTELLRNGQLGSVAPYPDGIDERHAAGPRVLQGGDTRLICYGADPTEQNDAPASCQPVGGRRWFMKRAGMKPPTLCGPWLITRGGVGQRELIIRAFDGRIAGRRTYAAFPVVACRDPDTLVVGGPEIQLARLPSLTPRWTQVAVAGGIRSVAAVRDTVAYAPRRAAEVVIVSLVNR